jgi:DNA-binding CsgD family transcriptional regulator
LGDQSYGFPELGAAAETIF